MYIYSRTIDFFILYWRTELYACDEQFLTVTNKMHGIKKSLLELWSYTLLHNMNILTIEHISVNHKIKSGYRSNPA